MITWKLKNKKTGKFLNRTFKSRSEARTFNWSASAFDYDNKYVIVKATTVKSNNKKMKGSTIMNTKPQLKKVKFGTPVHKAKPVHRSF